MARQSERLRRAHSYRAAAARERRAGRFLSAGMTDAIADRLERDYWRDVNRRDTNRRKGVS